MNDDKLTTPGYWDNGYKDINFLPMAESYPIVREIKKIFNNNGGDVLEIGCFPGRFLYHFGKAGYRLNGIDQTKYLEKMIDWFKQNNFTIGKFIKEDIFNLNITDKYDVVFSSGFIEHFSNFEEVIKIHLKLVKDDGLVFITTPNFSGLIQRKLHGMFDKNNLSKHNLLSMDPEKWSKILIESGFEVIKSGYIGGFDFWVGNEDRKLFKKIMIKLIRLFMPMRFLPNNKSYSPEIIIIARKKI